MCSCFQLWASSERARRHRQPMWMLEYIIEMLCRNMSSAEKFAILRQERGTRWAEHYKWISIGGCSTYADEIHTWNGVKNARLSVPHSCDAFNRVKLGRGTRMCDRWVRQIEKIWPWRCVGEALKGVIKKFRSISHGSDCEQWAPKADGDGEKESQPKHEMHTHRIQWNEVSHTAQALMCACVWVWH